MADPASPAPFHSAQLTEQCLERIAQADPALRAFIRVMPEDARAQSMASDKRRRRHAGRGGLDGVPVAIKDNIDIAGLPSSGGIGHYAGAMALRDAAIVAQLKAAGAVLIGKTNLHEAALGATTDNPWFGRCDNPLRAGFTPGGSSGGSAAAVAAAMCVLAVGTDTMGSVRIPAAYCGIAGFKPTRGALALDGVMPLSPTLDSLGLMAASAALLAGAWHALTDTAAPAVPQVPVWRIALARDFPDEQSAPLAALMQNAASTMCAHGIAPLEQSLADVPFTGLRRDAFILCEIEGAAVHAAALAADPEGFSPQLRAMLGFGARQAPARAMEVRERLLASAAHLAALLDGVDALLLPTTPQAAFAHGMRVPDNQADFTVLANVTGWPAISIPWGRDASGMPLGLQLIGKADSDAQLLALAAWFESIRDKTTPAIEQ